MEVKIVEDGTAEYQRNSDEMIKYILLYNDHLKALRIPILSGISDSFSYISLSYHPRSHATTIFIILSEDAVNVDKNLSENIFP